MAIDCWELQFVSITLAFSLSVFMEQGKGVGGRPLTAPNASPFTCVMDISMQSGGLRIVGQPGAECLREYCGTKARSMASQEDVIEAMVGDARSVRICSAGSLGPASLDLVLTHLCTRRGIGGREGRTYAKKG